MKKSVQLFQSFISITIRLWLVSIFLLLATDTYEPGHLAAPWMYSQLVSSVVLVVASLLGQHYSMTDKRDSITKVIQSATTLYLLYGLSILYHIATSTYIVVSEPYGIDYIAIAISVTITALSLVSTILYFIYSTIKPSSSR